MANGNNAFADIRNRATHRIRCASLWRWISKKWRKDVFVPKGERRKENASLFLYVIGLAFAVSRRISLGELINHYRFWPSRVPAKSVEKYILFWLALFLAGTITAAFFSPPDLNWAWCALCFFLLFLTVQTVQVNLHRNVWRPVVDSTNYRRRRKPRSFGRNLVSAFIGYLIVTWIFGIQYWVLGKSLDPQLESIWHALYFSFVTGSTLGYGEIKPSASSPSELILALISCHIFLSLLMVSVVVGTTTATIQASGDQATTAE